MVENDIKKQQQQYYQDVMNKYRHKITNSINSNNNNNNNNSNNNNYNQNSNFYNRNNQSNNNFDSQVNSNMPPNFGGLNNQSINIQNSISVSNSNVNIFETPYERNTRKKQELIVEGKNNQQIIYEQNDKKTNSIFNESNSEFQQQKDLNRLYRSIDGKVKLPNFNNDTGLKKSQYGLNNSNYRI